MEGGYICQPAFASDPWLDDVRTAPAFAELLDRVGARHDAAVELFAATRGDAIC